MENQFLTRYEGSFAAKDQAIEYIFSKFFGKPMLIESRVSQGKQYFNVYLKIPI